MDKVKEFIELALLISSAMPGITGMIFTFIHQAFPKDVVQEWTEEKVRAYVADYRVRQAALLNEFDARRTDE